jgi:DNA-binding response OmpR family regulator
MATTSIQNKPWIYVLDEPARVLVADDDPILREFACVHLSSPNATIETAPDGTAAFEMLKAGDFDIALLDIEMPPFDGFALLEKIRSEPSLRHLPIMMLTGHEDIASVDHAYALGANSFVTKPVNWRLLSYHIRYVMRTSRIEQELRQARDPGPSLEAFGEEHGGVLRAILDQVQALREAGGARRAEIDRIEQLARMALNRCDALRGPSSMVVRLAREVAADVA